jgi:hypothetical protein
MTGVGEWRGRTIAAIAVIGLLVRSPMEFVLTGLTGDLRLKVIIARILWLLWITMVLGLVYLWLRGRRTERLP